MFYFKLSKKVLVLVLELEEVFISPLDLNVEGGELENRGTAGDPEYVPVLRYATPVFNEQGERKGIVIVNVYAYAVLSFVREKLVGLEASKILINSDGQYLFHQESRKEFSFMFKNRDFSFGIDYPEESLEVLGKNKGTIYNKEEKHYVLFEKVWIGDSFWVLVNIIDEDVLLVDVNNLRNTI